MKASSTSLATGSAHRPSSARCPARWRRPHGREVRPVAQMAPAAHHGQVDTGAPALHLDGQDVHIAIVTTVSTAAGAAPWTKRSIGCANRPLAQTPALSAWASMRRSRSCITSWVSPRNKRSALCDIARVVGGGDQPTHGPRAALDLIQQTRPRAVVEHRVFAGAQAKHLLHQLDDSLTAQALG
jgi:hypothetical protein